MWSRVPTRGTEGSGSPSGGFPLRSFFLGRWALALALALVLAWRLAWPGGALLVLAVVGATGWVGLATLRRGQAERLPVGGILLADFLLETYLILATGAHGSPLLPLYGFTVLCAGLLLGLGGGLLFGGLAGACSSALAFLVPPDRSQTEPALPLLVQASFFVVLGVAAGSLARWNRRRAALLRAMRDRLDEATLEAETILSHLPWGVVSLDGRGRLRACNPAARRILPGGPGPVGGHLRDPQLGSLVAEALRAGRAVRRELEIPLPGGGGTRPVEALVVPVPGPQDRPRGLVLLLEDLRERRRLEAQARRQDRLAALGRFSAGLAHEIRNSLKPITGSAELLGEVPPGPQAEALREIILREAQKLEGFLESYLEAARDKELQKQRLRIDAWIREELQALETHPKVAGRCRFDLRIRDLRDPWVEADPARLARALRNVLLNAAEASQDGTVRVTVEERPEGWLRIGVRDWGCGMDPETLENLFTPLFSTKPDGTGLGLYVARRALERHGGRLTLVSRRGKGTLVTLDLPRQVSAGEAAA
jgi:signal transduction histidine kinase